MIGRTRRYRSPDRAPRERDKWAAPTRHRAHHFRVTGTYQSVGVQFCGPDRAVIRAGHTRSERSRRPQRCCVAHSRPGREATASRHPRSEGDHDERTPIADHRVSPRACPTCGSARTWQIDPSETDAEWFMWCESCACGEFPCEAADHEGGPTRFLMPAEQRLSVEQRTVLRTLGGCARRRPADCSRRAGNRLQASLSSAADRRRAPVTGAFAGPQRCARAGELGCGREAECEQDQSD